MEKVTYKDCFIQLVKQSTDTEYLGRGNPNAKILFVGREGSREKPLEEISEAKDWQGKIDKNEYPQFIWGKPLDKNNKQFAPGHTWNKYQILHDYIFQSKRPDDNGMNFEQNIFTTEMNVHRCGRTEDANTEGMRERKATFFKTDFIQQFPVVVLACSNYIKNNDKIREIDDTFGVTFDKDYIYWNKKNTKKYHFWVHFNKDYKTNGINKIVIHTRQLSNDIPDDLLKDIAKIIREFLLRTDHDFH